MADQEIPTIIRRAFGDPTPPDPPEIEPGDDGDGGHHHHIRIAYPVLMLLSNGSIQGNGWDGTVLLGWLWLSSFVTLALAAWAICKILFALDPMYIAFQVAVGILLAGAGGLIWKGLCRLGRRVRSRKPVAADSGHQGGAS